MPGRGMGERLAIDPNNVRFEPLLYQWRLRDDDRITSSTLEHVLGMGFFAP
jgi:hypothetical protein